MKSTIFNNKTILITGGTGSFGGYFVHEIVQQKVKKVIIFSRDEDKQYTMARQLKNHKNKLQFAIGDVRDFSSLSKWMFGVDYVIHAAALKQIPMAEDNVIEVIKTNVLGAQNVVDSAILAGVKKVISISTDKAVEPVNVVGMTKGLQERIFTQANYENSNKTTKFASVRYGNVVSSRGSVIPLFKELLKNATPLTITDKRMTRFILTLEETVKLIVNAFTDMQGGEVFIPKIKPVRILDLAMVMSNGGEIVETGIRPGEKIHEVLISKTESMRSVNRKDSYIIMPQTLKLQKSTPLEFELTSNTGPFLTEAQIKKLVEI